MINKPFLIRNRLPLRRYLRCYNYSVHLSDKLKNELKGNLNQQWRFDERTKTIKTMQSHERSLDARPLRQNGKSKDVACKVTNARWYQLFKYEKDNHAFVNERGDLLDLQWGVDTIGYDNAVLKGRSGGDSQKWDIIYIDDIGKDFDAKDKVMLSEFWGL